MPKIDDVVPFAAPRNAIKALQRLRKSYKGLLAEKPLTEADEAILLAVQITLNNARNAQSL